MSPEEYAKSQEIVQIVITKAETGFKIVTMNKQEVVNSIVADGNDAYDTIDYAMALLVPA